jgi:hypothetical protein
MYTLDLISWWDVSTYIFCVSGKVTLLSASGRPLPHPLSHVTQLPSSTSILLDLMEKRQMMKFMLRKAPSDFTAGGKCDEKHLELENDCEEGMAQTLSDHAKTQRLHYPMVESSNEQDSEGSLSSFHG